MRIKDILDIFSPHECLSAICLLKELDRKGGSFSDLLGEEGALRRARKHHARATYPKRLEAAVKYGKFERKAAAEKAEASSAQRPAKIPFLKPGEGEIVQDLKCSCGEEMYIEALCAKTAIKNKCVRIAYCVECSKEVKIR
ncbi:MAG: hypothetical protein KAV87_28155 [Desulfobacteraceae bacterium]|nr:hypothetical protein [Desulfobacteraceae bacterium]